MKRNKLLTIMLCFATSLSIAQNTGVQYAHSLENIRVVVLSLSGNSQLLAGSSNELKINSDFEKKGDIWGWRSPSVRPDFKPTVRISHDTLYYTSPAKYIPSVIGVSTYSETVRNIIVLPADKQILVRKCDYLKVESEMLNLVVSEGDIILADLQKANTGRLQCHASINLSINGGKRATEFEFNGKGANAYCLNANSVLLNFK